MAGGIFGKLLAAVISHLGSTVCIIIPGHPLLPHHSLSQEIGITHIIEQPEGLLLMRAVSRNEPHIARSVSQ